MKRPCGRCYHRLKHETESAKRKATNTGGEIGGETATITEITITTPTNENNGGMDHTNTLIIATNDLVGIKRKMTPTKLRTMDLPTENGDKQMNDLTTNKAL